MQKDFVSFCPLKNKVTHCKTYNLFRNFSNGEIIDKACKFRLIMNYI